MRRVFPLLVLLAACASSPTIMQDGRAALEAGDEAGAEAKFRKAMKNEETKDDASRELAALLVERGDALAESDPAAARAAYEEALALRPTEPATRVEYARFLADNHEFEAALEVLSERSCRPCRRIVAVVLNERGRSKLVAEDWEGALADFRKSNAQGDDPHVMLEMTEVYTLGRHGSGLEAVGRLDTARALIRREQSGLQESWAVQRRLVMLTAAALNDQEAIAAASQLEDPRRGLNDQERLYAWAELQYEVSAELIRHTHYESGVARGLAMLKHVEGNLPADQEERLRGRVLDLYVKRAAHQLANGNGRAAATGIEEGLALDADHNTLRYQAVLAAAATKVKNGLALLDGTSSDDAEHARVKATLSAMRARGHLDAGRFAGALKEIERASAIFPELPEVHLARAEWLAAVRFDDMKKTWTETFKEGASFSYPGRRINRYGQALAEINWMRSKIEDHEEEQNHPLRMPSFLARLGALESTIRAFYPWDTHLVPEPEPRIVFINKSSGDYPVTVSGAGLKEEKLEIKAGESVPVVFKKPGLVTVKASSDEMLFVEENTAIEFELG